MASLFCLPGDLLQEADADGERTRVGGGVAVLQPPPSSSAPVRLMATRRGRARLAAPAPARKKRRAGGEGACWVEPAARSRYAAQPGDHVVGAVVQVQSDQFVVDVGGAHSAVLPALSFEGATRRNRPQLRAGSLVFARVASAGRDAEPELSCVDEDGRLGAAGFGELAGAGHGYVLRVPAGAARALLGAAAAAEEAPGAPGAELGRRLRALGEATPFEMVVGANGRVWLSAGSAGDVLRVAARVLEAAGAGGRGGSPPGGAVGAERM